MKKCLLSIGLLLSVSGYAAPYINCGIPFKGISVKFNSDHSLSYVVVSDGYSSYKFTQEDCRVANLNYITCDYTMRSDDKILSKNVSIIMNEGNSGKGTFNLTYSPDPQSISSSFTLNCSFK